MACKEIGCELDPDGSAAGKSYSAMLKDEEFNQETFDGWDTTSIDDLFDALSNSRYFKVCFRVDVNSIVINSKCSFLYVHRKKHVSIE